MNKPLVLGIIVLAAVLLSINLNKPFIGQHDWNGVVYGQQAKNFFRFGYLPLKFGATMATADIPSDDRKYLTHYTPVLPVLISFSYRLFGVSEWSTRLIPIVASLVSVLLVMMLGKELISSGAGTLAGILMIMTPMFIYYGKNPVHEVVLLPFALLGFYSYLRWRRSREKKWWKILLLASTAAMLIGWSGYYAMGLIFIHGILFQPKEKMKFLQLPLIAVALLALFLFHASILSSQAAGELRNIFFARLGGASIGLIDFLIKELRYSINLFTASLLLLSMIWIFSVIPGPSAVSSGWSNSLTRNLYKGNTILLFFLGIFGLAHIMIFRQAAWYHEYLLFPLLPFIAIASAEVIQRGINQLRSGMAQLIGVTVIILFVAGERLPYAKALLKSEYVRDVYEEAVEYGKVVKVNPDVIVPIERDVYFIFYADTVRKK
ncbi:glycosyltransferase family 39 protein [Candidatus Collierbacteria bacterium]|nr:glycosyltransferase family 39 protein [Candidatus Collierbacteria bacterium]